MTVFYFDEIMNVNEIDQKVVYDKVSRIKATADEDGDIYLELDVHTELYPVTPGKQYRMVISDTLMIDGSDVPGYFPEEQQKSLADKFEYVMHGLLYKMTEDKESSGGRVIVYISFGGLQLMLKGDPIKMHKFSVDTKVFLLLRKM